MPRDKTGHFYFEWYPTIYQSDTQHLTLAEDGAYRRLLDHYMTTRAPLPADDNALARIVGIGITEWVSIKERIITYFKPTGLFLHHAFCDSTLQKHDARIHRSRANGKGGGRPKLQKDKAKNPPGYETITQHKPDNRTEQNNKKERKKENKISGSRFTLTDLPDDWRMFCMQARPDLNPDDVFLEFRDYWIALPGARGVKLDWLATWRNRVREKKSTHGGINGFRTPTKDERAREATIRGARAAGLIP